MLMFLLNEIPSSCQLLVLLLVGMGLLLLSATCWTIQTIKEFQIPCSTKKWKKYLAPCLTSLGWSGDKDPGRSSKDLNLEYTLRMLDKNMQYLAWQMKCISGPIAHTSVSSTTVETVAYSWTHSSAGSRSRTPPSLASVDLGRDVQSWRQQQHLTRPTGAGFQQVHLAALSHRKVDFNIQQKKLKKEWAGATARSKSLTRLIPLAPMLQPATQRTDSQIQIGASRIFSLSYKEQELLNWHIQKKHQQKEVASLHLAPVATRAFIGNDGTQTGRLMHWVSQQPPATQQSRSHTPPQSSIADRHTPPKSLHSQSPGPGARPLIPPPEDLPLPPMLVCKSESHSNVHESVEVKLSSGTLKEERAEMLTMLGQSKSPAFRDSGRPGTPKENEEVSHGTSGRPGSPKEDLARVGRVGSPKDKQVESKVSSRTGHTMHTLSWTNMPEIQRPSQTQEQPNTARPKFLDPSFMCQNQLELPCIATVREQNQKSCTLAESPLLPPVRSPKPQCLAHTILQSLDTEQAMRDLKMHLTKGLETGHNSPSVEYPICLLCGRCTPYCPHPRTRYSPCLLVYPRLEVQDGEARMTLGFLLKIKKSEADEWGLTQRMDVPKTPHSRERPSKGEKSRRSTPHRKSQARAARPQEPKTPYRTPRVVRQLFSESDDQKTRSQVVTPKTPDTSSRVARQLFPESGDQTTRGQAVTPKTPDRSPHVARQLFPESGYKTKSQVVTPKTPDRSPRVARQLFPESGYKTKSQVVTPKTPDRSPRVARQLFPESGDQKTRSRMDTPQALQGSSTPKPPKTQQSPKTQFRSPAARPLPSTPMQIPPKTPEKPPSILKQLMSSMKRFWARMQQEKEKCAEMCPEVCTTKKSSNRSPKKPGTPLPAPVSPEPRKEPGTLSVATPTSVAQMKGDISNTSQASPLFTNKQEASPFKLATPQTPKTMGTPIINQDSTRLYSSPRDRKRSSLRFEEPDSPWVSKKGDSSHKKSASPRTPKRSPSLLRKTPSRQSTPKVTSRLDSG